MSKKITLDAIKESLPGTPKKKAALVAALIDDSPTTHGVLESMDHVRTPEDQEETQVAAATFKDVLKALEATKHKRSSDARAAVNIRLSFLCGEIATKVHFKTKVARKTNNRGRVGMSTAHRAKFFAVRSTGGHILKGKCDQTLSRMKLENWRMIFGQGLKSPAGQETRRILEYESTKALTFMSLTRNRFWK